MKYHSLTKKLYPIGMVFPIGSGLGTKMIEDDKIIREYLKDKAEKINTHIRILTKIVNPSFKPNLEIIEYTLDLTEQTLKEKFCEYLQGRSTIPQSKVVSETVEELAKIAEEHFKEDT